MLWKIETRRQPKYVCAALPQNLRRNEHMTGSCVGPGNARIILCHGRYTRSIAGLSRETNIQFVHAFLRNLVANLTCASSPTAWLKRSVNFDKASIQPIVLLFKRFSSPEQRYFPTELEMAGIWWAVKKLRHMVQAAPKLVPVPNAQTVASGQQW